MGGVGGQGRLRVSVANFIRDFRGEVCDSRLVASDFKGTFCTRQLEVPNSDVQSKNKKFVLVKTRKPRLSQ